MRKMKFFLVLVLLIGVYITKLCYAKENKLPLKNKIIFLDPGHGGLDPGTLSGDIKEKDINLEISITLQTELSKLGAKVLLTRKGDYDLSKPKARLRKKSDFDNRIKLINESKADYYLSIHLNYLENEKYYGPQVFYNQNDELNKVLASNLQEAFNQELNVDREIKNIPSSTYMYSKLNIPGVLIECGFLSNARERELLKSKEYQKKLAIIIVNVLKKL